VLLFPPIVLDLIARTISRLTYKSRMITERVRQHLNMIATRESSTMSHKRAVKYVNISEPRTRRQLLRRICRACSMNSWRFPFSSRMGMEQLPSPINEAIVLVSPTPDFVSYVTTFVNISFSCSFHSSILLLTSFSPPPWLKCFYFFP
jgi:hypothetical protein